MARKKSAAKRASEEAAKKEAVVEINDTRAEQENVPAEKLSEEYASSSESEEEDEFGELLTDNVEQSIQKVMKALKTDPKHLLDPNAKFFDETEASASREKGDKPIYLKDYHRMNLLSGDYKNDEENEYGTVDGEKPFVVTEREERNKLLSDIKNAFDEDGEDEDDDFLTKKKVPTKRADNRVQLPDPKANAEEFLSSFLDSKAWVPTKDDKVIDLDQIDQDDEQEFDDAVEDFERAYNFRYEDPNSAEIVSYARTQASLRRGKTNARKRARDKKHAIIEQEKHEVEQALQKKKNVKLIKVMDRLSKIKEAVGDDISDDVIEKVFGESLLNDDFDDADWDSKMAEIFNEQYYDAEITKPEWDEDDEIMAEYHEGENDEAENNEGEVQADSEEALGEQPEDKEEGTKKSRKEKLKEKKAAKKEKLSIKEKAEKLVEANTTRLMDEVEEERGRSRGDDVKFKYREVSPESFGLSTRDIFLADDLELNQFIGIKKFAPYRPKELALKDKRKFAKKYHLQQWRKEVFKDRNGAPRQPEEKDDEIWIPMDEEPKKKKSKKNKKTTR